MRYWAEHPEECAERMKAGTLFDWLTGNVGVKTNEQQNQERRSDADTSPDSARSGE